MSMQYIDLIDLPGMKSFLYRWVGYKIRYFGCWIGIIGSNMIRKGRTEVEREIKLEDIIGE